MTVRKKCRVLLLQVDGLIRGESTEPLHRRSCNLFIGAPIGEELVYDSRACERCAIEGMQAPGLAAFSQFLSRIEIFWMRESFVLHGSGESHARNRRHAFPGLVYYPDATTVLQVD